jgi:hypothetical protein
MKKAFLSVITFLSSFLLMNVVYANTINDINMDIYIDENGDATIKEVWDYTSSKNTEIYHPYYNIGSAEITDFTVSDSTGQKYTFVNNWNVNGNFESKKFKNGYNYADGGVELCLGISHYGTYSYYLRYKIKGFVANVSDAQVVYWRLLQPTSENLKHYYIKIYSDFEYADDLDVWGFGIKGAYAYVHNGVIELTTDKKVKSDEYVVVLAKFPSGTFKTNNTIKGSSFDDILKLAKEGSSPYKSSSDDDRLEGWFRIITTFIMMGLMMIPIGKIASAGARARHKIAKKNLPPKDVPMFRDLPCKDDIFQAFYISNEYDINKKQTDFLGSLILKWIRDDVVTVGNEKAQKSIVMNVLPKDFHSHSEQEKEMYTMFYTASKDGVLEQNEFKKYCEKHYERVLNWFDKVVTEEFERIKGSLAKPLNEPKLYQKIKYEAEPELDAKAKELAGLKKFYNEFGNIKDKHAIEVKLWREHLMYAQIFGVAEKVANEFSKLYPDVIKVEDISTVVYVNHFSYVSVHSASAARSRAESYSSGGGGFSSGGGGGGSFGGGSFGGGSMGSR